MSESESDFDLERDLKSVEDRLRGWTPAPLRLDRDRMLFEAGQASRRFVSPWPLATAAAALVAGGLALGWSSERAQRVAAETRLAEALRTRPIEPIRLDPHPAPALLVRDEGPRDPSSYLTLTRHFRDLGDLALSPIPGPPSANVTPHDDATLTPRGMRGRNQPLEL